MPQYTPCCMMHAPRSDAREPDDTAVWNHRAAPSGSTLGQHACVAPLLREGGIGYNTAAPSPWALATWQESVKRRIGITYGGRST